MLIGLGLLGVPYRCSIETENNGIYSLNVSKMSIDKC